MAHGIRQISVSLPATDIAVDQDFDDRSGAITFMRTERRLEELEIAHDALTQGSASDQIKKGLVGAFEQELNAHSALISQLVRDD